MSTGANRVPFTKHLSLALRIALLALLLAAFGLRVVRLDFQELRGDEAFGYFFSQQGFGEIIGATLALREPHPVGSYFLQRLWLSSAGGSEYALRFWGVGWGLLAVALIYRLGRRMGFGAWQAMPAMLLMALSPYAIWHAQDARMYPMSLALTLAAVYFGLEALQRQRWPWITAYVLAAWLALHTHYYAVFVLVGLNSFVIGRAVFVARTRSLVFSWLLWQVIVVALYLPWLMRTGMILSGYGGNGDSPGIGDAIGRAAGVFTVGETLPGDQRLWFGVAAAVLLIIGVLRLALGSSTDRRNLGLLACYLGVPLAAIWYSAQARPIFNERYLIVAVPPFYLLMAAAFEGKKWQPVTQKTIAIASTVLYAVVFVGMALSLVRLYTDPAYSKTRGWRELAAAFERVGGGVAPEQVRIAQNYPDPTLWYYYRGPIEHLVLPPVANDAGGARSAVEALANQGVTRVLLPVQPAGNWDNAGLGADALSGRYDRIAQLQVGVWPLQVYAVPAALAPLTTTFTNGVSLKGVAVMPTELTPGGVIAVHLDWRGDPAGLTGNEKVFVQLLNQDGQLVAQDDRPLRLTGPLAAGSGLAAYGVPLPAELASGNYRLVTGLYAPDVAGAPRIPATGGADSVVLSELSVP